MDRRDKVVEVLHARVAESCKLLENIFRSVNIALVNELKMTFSRVAIDVWEVMAAGSNSRSGICRSTQGSFMLLVVRPHSLDKNPTSLRVDTVHKTVLDIDPP
jgi:hypothetical protein